MKKFLIIDFNKNTCEIAPSDLPIDRVKNMKKNKTKKDLIETITSYLNGGNDDEI